MEYKKLSSLSLLFIMKKYLGVQALVEQSRSPEFQIDLKWLKIQLEDSKMAHNFHRSISNKNNVK